MRRDGSALFAAGLRGRVPPRGRRQPLREHAPGRAEQGRRSTRASTATPEASTRPPTARSPATRSRTCRTRRLSQGPRPASSGSARHAGRRRRVLFGGSVRRPGDGPRGRSAASTSSPDGVGLTDGSRPAPPALRPAHVADPRAAAAVQARRASCVRARGRRDAAGGVLGVRPSTPRCSPRGARSRACRSSLVRGCVIELPFVAFAVLCRSSAEAADRRARDAVVGAGPVGRLEHPGQGHVRRGRVRPAGGDDRAARTAAGARPSARAPPLITRSPVHAPLRRRHHRRAAARMRVARHHAGYDPAVALAGARSPGRRARCSSAPTSGASACTWPWSAAARRPMPVTRRVDATAAQWAAGPGPAAAAGSSRSSRGRA